MPKEFECEFAPGTICLGHCKIQVEDRGWEEGWKKLWKNTGPARQHTERERERERERENPFPPTFAKGRSGNYIFD